MTITFAGPSTAPGLVLSNALGTSAELWQPQLPALAKRFRVVRYEHAPRSSVAGLASELLGELGDLGFERVSFCGLSLGAMVGMWIAANEPRWLDRLVLACTSARFGIPAQWREKAALVRAQGMDAVAGDALSKWFTSGYRNRGPFLTMQLETPQQEYALGLEAIGRFDFRDRLHEIKAPTLVIAGAQDSATTPADAAFIAQRIPGARLLVLENAAHLANVEQAPAFTKAVMEHLCGGRPAAGGPSERNPVDNNGTGAAQEGA